jgi:tetratricopeptide (TPR) repeat protein
LISAAEDVSEGVELCKEAVRIFRGLAKQDPGRYDLQLARALGNLGSVRSLGDFDAAVTERIFRRAINLLRRLGRDSLEACHEDLAAARFNLASFPSAIRLTREAVGLYRRLVAENPTLYVPYLAAGLFRLGKHLERFGRLGQARLATEEGTDLCKAIARLDLEEA